MNKKLLFILLLTSLASLKAVPVYSSIGSTQQQTEDEKPVFNSYQLLEELQQKVVELKEALEQQTASEESNSNLDRTKTAPLTYYYNHHE